MYYDICGDFFLQDLALLVLNSQVCLLLKAKPEVAPLKNGSCIAYKQIWRTNRLSVKAICLN